MSRPPRPRIRGRRDEHSLSYVPFGSVVGFTGMQSVYPRARHPGETASLRLLRKMNPAGQYNGDAPYSPDSFHSRLPTPAVQNSRTLELENARTLELVSSTSSAHSSCTFVAKKAERFVPTNPNAPVIRIIIRRFKRGEAAGSKIPGFKRAWRRWFKGSRVQARLAALLQRFKGYKVSRGQARLMPLAQSRPTM